MMVALSEARDIESEFKRHGFSGEQGEIVDLSSAVWLGHDSFVRYEVLGRKKSNSAPAVLQFTDQVGGTKRYLRKAEDLRIEQAIMKLIRFMNDVWAKNGFHEYALQVYDILPFGASAGLIELVEDCDTLDHLKRKCALRDRSQRVLSYLGEDPGALAQLARSTSSFLAMSYILGIGDNHGDNVMLKPDGTLFRIDFGYVFGCRPVLDAPRLSLPHAVITALEEGKSYDKVLVDSENLVRIILQDKGSMFVHMMVLACEGIKYCDKEWHSAAMKHMQKISFGGFRGEMRQIRGSMMKAVKNLAHNTLGYGANPHKAAASPAVGGGSNEVHAMMFRCAFEFSPPWFAVHCALELDNGDESIRRYAQHYLQQSSEHSVPLMVEVLVSESDVVRPRERMLIALALQEMDLSSMPAQSLEALARMVVKTRAGGDAYNCEIPANHVMGLTVLAKRGVAGLATLERALSREHGVQDDGPRREVDQAPLRHIFRELNSRQRGHLTAMMGYVLQASDGRVRELGLLAAMKLGQDNLPRSLSNRVKAMGRDVRPSFWRPRGPTAIACSIVAVAALRWKPGLRLRASTVVRLLWAALLRRAGPPRGGGLA